MCLYGVFEPYYYQHNYRVELKRTSSVIYGNEIHANKGSVFVGAGHIESGNADALLFNAPRPLEFLYYIHDSLKFKARFIDIPHLFLLLYF